MHLFGASSPSKLQLPQLLRLLSSAKNIHVFLQNLDEVTGGNKSKYATYTFFYFVLSLPKGGHPHTGRMREIDEPQRHCTPNLPRLNAVDNCGLEDSRPAVGAKLTPRPAGWSPQFRKFRKVRNLELQEFQNSGKFETSDFRKPRKFRAFGNLTAP